MSDFIKGVEKVCFYGHTFITSIVAWMHFLLNYHCKKKDYGEGKKHHHNLFGDGQKGLRHQNLTITKQIIAKSKGDMETC